MQSRLRLAACAAGLFAAAQVHAAPVLFDFENQPIVTETPFTLTASGLAATFAGPAGVDPGAFGISTNFPTSTGFQYRLMDVDFLTIGSAFGASGAALTITFSAPLSAVAFDFALDDPASLSTLTLTTGAGGAASASGALSAGFRYPEGTLAFAGAPFTTITLQSSAIDFQIDNLQATVAAVPEPAALLLFGAGLPLLALARRRGSQSNPKDTP